MMSRNKLWLAGILVCSLLLMSCVYIVLPEGLETSGSSQDEGWSGVVTKVEPAGAGSLHIELTIRNNTGAWSAMKAVEGKPAVLKTGGESIDCPVVVMGTGGHRLAPGLQLRGFTSGTKAAQETQLIFVECPAAETAPGAELTIQYAYFNGELDYYHQEEGKIDGTMVVKLDDMAADLEYPIYQPVDGLIEAADVKITAISENIVTLVEAQRTDTGFLFTWRNENPTDFALKTHIGTPPVICSDGILYGWYEIMDLATTPLTSAKSSVDWTTELKVPADAGGCYILLSVESKNVRLYVNHLIDITDK